MDRKILTAHNLAARLLAGPWTAAEIAARLDDVLGPGQRRGRNILAAAVTDLGNAGYPPTPKTVAACLIRSIWFRPSANRPLAAVLDPPRFAPAPPFAGLPVPALATTGDLARWLGLGPPKLDWLADERRQHERAANEKLRHYHYTTTPKRNGTMRLIEAPKPRLKAIQRRILHEILDAVPVHDAAKGFVAGRSCLDGAQVHAGEAMVATFDLTGFFPSIGAARIHGLFRALGYPWAVARQLTGLCTTITPAAIRARLPDGATRDLHRVPHLPQGAPSSPALANLLAWTLDRRLRGLADAAGANYTRYADDLAFSGGMDFAAGVGRFGKAVATILFEEGFALNAGKTRLMPRQGRQHVTGIVVNAHCNIDRESFDALKATLYNCAKQGPDGQNSAGLPEFQRHLEGRVMWVEQINPQRGARLRRLFDLVDWTGAPPK